MQKPDMEIFNVKKLNDLDVTVQYHIKISNVSTVSENLDVNVGTNSA
jgi:hypothetical protein